MVPDRVILRVILIVLDSVGCGELPDARTYGDTGSNTLGNIARQVPLQIPALRRLGLARAGGRARAEDVLGDPGSTAVVANGAAVLGSALAWLANALDPARIVVGGGLGLDAGYRDAAAHEMRPLVEAAGTRDVPVVPAGLGELAGPLGAAIAGAERSSRHGR